MKAKVKDDYRWKTFIAFGGHEFVKGEWRPVPAGYEERAKSNPYLEVQEEGLPPAENSVKVHDEPPANAQTNAPAQVESPVNERTNAPVKPRERASRKAEE